MRVGLTPATSHRGISSVVFLPFDSEGRPLPPRQTDGQAAAAAAAAQRSAAAANVLSADAGALFVVALQLSYALQACGRGLGRLQRGSRAEKPPECAAQGRCAAAPHLLAHLEAAARLQPAPGTRVCTPTALVMTLALAASSSAAAVSTRSRQALQRPGGAALLLQRPAAVAAARPRRPSRTAAVVKPLSAAQKKVFTSFTDMVQQSTEPVLVEFYATW